MIALTLFMIKLISFKKFPCIAQPMKMRQIFSKSIKGTKKERNFLTAQAIIFLLF
jgi:hypothetical protein